MTKKTSNIANLLGKVNQKSDAVDKPQVKNFTNPVASADRARSVDSKIKDPNDKVVNPAVGLATGVTSHRAKSIKEPVLHLTHDQVRFFKYHDRHISSLDTLKVQQIRKSIEEDGQNYPGIVRKTNDVTDDGKVIYELIVGRLRFEATRTVGYFKAFLRDVDDQEAARLMFSENEDRQDITPFERWLSIIPLINDKVMSITEVAKSIGWDKGRVSKSVKAKAVYEECNLSQFLIDVAKVKLGTLIELQAIYDDRKIDVVNAIKHIEENYPNRKDGPFLKSVIKYVTDVKNPTTQTLYLSGSKVKIKQLGDNLTLSFEGKPKRDDFEQLVNQLEKIKALK